MARNTNTVILVGQKAFRQAHSRIYQNVKTT